MSRRLLPAALLLSLLTTAAFAQTAPAEMSAQDISAALTRPATPAARSSSSKSDADLAADLFGGGSAAVERAVRDVARPDPDGRCKPPAASLPGGASVSEAAARLRILAVVPLSPTPQPSVDLALRFGYAGYALTPDDRRQLDELVRALQGTALKSTRITIAGHTDPLGDRDLNLRLSCARGISVLDYLISQGIAAERMGVFGFGSSHARSSDAESRRVEIRRAD